MNILVLNSGSSSIKYQVIEMPSREVLCSGLLERIGHADAQVSHKPNRGGLKKELEILDHKAGLALIASIIMDESYGVIRDPTDIHAVGHRVVHGGDQFSNTVLINEDVKDQIQKFCSLAPLHNPANLQGILMAEEVFESAIQVAVFDTAFHQSISRKAYTYAIPRKLTGEIGIRLYGFHGTSHKYVSQKAIDYLGVKSNKIITIHLGNGCSVTAVKNGKSFDHSLGFSPLNGLVMGTRSGDIDHSIIFHLVDNLGYDLATVSKMLIKESGMLGLTGFSDLRDIQSAAENGNEDCKLALEINSYRIKKYIGAYASAMNGLDAIVFTAGIGENSNLLRSMVCSEMDFLGIEINESKNSEKLDELIDVSGSGAKVKTLVIATNEELEIAEQTFDLLA
ncbi:acetate kinase [Spirosomataceae bacterium TFI 002]|nr:acetate kinase [Spirosomataceae bacterium TFI 002]